VGGASFKNKCKANATGFRDNGLGDYSGEHNPDGGLLASFATNPAASSIWMGVVCLPIWIFMTTVLAGHALVPEARREQLSVRCSNREGNQKACQNTIIELQTRSQMPADVPGWPPHRLNGDAVAVSVSTEVQDSSGSTADPGLAKKIEAIENLKKSLDQLQRALLPIAPPAQVAANLSDC